MTDITHIRLVVIQEEKYVRSLWKIPVFADISVIIETARAPAGKQAQ
jgi:hypothetical protein